MKQLILTLGDNTTIDLVFDVLPTDIATRWAAEVSKNYPIYEAERFKGFAGKDTSYYLTSIQHQIDIVNLYAPNTINSNVDIDQNTLNYLHKFFENLRGEVNTGTNFYNSAPDGVKEAIDRFNILIHEFEHLLRDSLYPELVVTYKDRLRYDLHQDDYELFTFKWEFGCVYINYCEVGKPLLDVFKDRDDQIGAANVRPLKYYSADFTIKFGESTPDDLYQQRLAQFNSWYNAYPLKFQHTSVGMIPVAKLNLEASGFTKNNILQAIDQNQRVHSTCIQ